MAMRSTFEANPLRYAKDSNLLAEDTARAFGHPEWIADDDSDAWVWAAEVIDGD
jgi:hypothetical protein